MFQRLRGAVERSLAEAEELARQRPTVSDGRNRTSSASRGTNPGRARSDSAARLSRAKKEAGQDLSKDAVGGDGAVDPDPAVFEAAFVIDDSEGPSRIATPRPPEKDGGGGDKTVDAGPSSAAAGPADGEKDGDGGQQDGAGGPDGQKSALLVPGADLPSDVRLRLKKLEKLEATYPELLRSYRIAHGRAVSIEPFERALKEHTPLTSIKDPNALVEYLGQVNVRADMVMEELKRLSAEKDDYRKKYEEKGEEAGALKDELAGLRLSKNPGRTADVAAAEPGTGAMQQSTTPAAKEVEVNSAPANNKSPSLPRAAEANGGATSDQADQADQAGQEEASAGELFSYDGDVSTPQVGGAEAANTAEAAEAAKAAKAAEAVEAAGTAEAVEAAETLAALKAELQAVKANGNGLVEKLASANRELDQSRDAAHATEGSFKSRLEAQDAEIATLTEQLTAAISGMEQQKLEFQRRVAALEDQADGLSIAPDPTESSSRPQPAPSTAATKKKNKKKKKKKGGAGGGAPAAPGADDNEDKEEVDEHQQLLQPEQSEQSEQPEQPEHPEQPLPAPPAAQVAALEAELSRLKQADDEKDQRMQELLKQSKMEDDLREEIETFQESLMDIGNHLVMAKQRIKELEADRDRDVSRLVELKEELARAMASSAPPTEDQTRELEALRRKHDELQGKSQSLRTDLGVAEQLAQARFKEITDLRDTLQKLQPELRSLRQESNALKATKEELATRTADLRSLERGEKELRKELARAQQTAAGRESQIKALEQSLLAETGNKLRLEEAQRVAGRDLRRSEAEKIEISSKGEKTAWELQAAREEAGKLRPRVKELEAELARLRKETMRLQEETDLKAQQYANAQGLLGGMRDQTAELTTQLREARSQAESAEEELVEVQRLLAERTREGDTMRRLLEDADGRADERVRDMRAQLEAAVEERDRIEDESGAAARRRIRETEELTQKVRDLERDLQALGHHRDDLERRELDWRKRGEELEAAEGRAGAEARELRMATAELRQALETSEAQGLEAERQRADLRKLLDEARLRHEGLARELKTAQAGSATNHGSIRRSTDSARPGSGGADSGAGAGADTTYLKTILLQFLKQKDGKLRAQLVPVLGKLLRFEKDDEQKWMTAVQHIEIR